MIYGVSVVYMMCLSYVYDMMCGGEAGIVGEVGDKWRGCNVGHNV